MKSRSPASPRRRRAPLLGARPITGRDHKFLVSIAGPKGGGRSFVYARNPREAGEKAAVNTFVHRTLVPKRTEFIITDLSKKKNAQTFLNT